MKRFWIFLVCLLPVLVGFSPLPQTENLNIDVQAGVGGWYRAGQWVPLQILVSSNSANVNGQLQVRVEPTATNAAQFETTYRSPFTIASGDSKRVFLYVSLHDFTRNVQIELLNEVGEVVGSARAEVTQVNPSDLLYVAVTEDASQFLDISRQPIGRGNSYQANWQIDDLPPNADALRAIDAMVFDNVDTGRLSSDQRLALENWVLSGGHLVVMGGTNWQRTTSGLEALLPSTAEGTETLPEGIPALGAFLHSQDTEPLGVQTVVTENTPKADAIVMAYQDDTPLIVRQTLGAGVVDFVALDATLEPLRSWRGTDSLWRELMITAPPRPSWTYGIGRFNLAQDAVSNIEINLPGVLQLVAFLLAYILLVGPVNYLLLNRLGRRELAWLTIPVLILAFTVFAYFTGFSLRGDAVTVNQVVMVQEWPGQESARSDGVIGVLSPRRTTYDVIVSGDLNLRSVPNADSPGNLTQVTITEGEDYRADNIPVDAAIMTKFASSGELSAGNFSGSATWEFGSDATARIQGEVTNHLDVALEDAVILVDDEFQSLGELAPGQSGSFDLPVSLHQTLRLPLGNRVDLTQPVLSGFGSSNRCILPNALNVTYDNVMRNQGFECSGQSEEDRKRRRRGLLLAAVTSEIDRNGGRGADVYLFGWVEQPPLDVDLSNVTQIDSGTTLYIYKIPSSYDFRGDAATRIPPGFMTWTQIVEDNLTRTIEPSADLSFRLGGDQRVALRFTPLPVAPAIEVGEIVLEMRLRSRSTPTFIELWNWESQDWEVVSFDDQDFTDNNQLQLIIDNQDYVGVQNSVQVRVSVREQTVSQEITGLRITLHGTGRSS